MRTRPFFLDGPEDPPVEKEQPAPEPEPEQPPTEPQPTEPEPTTPEPKEESRWTPERRAAWAQKMTEARQAAMEKRTTWRKKPKKKKRKKKTRDELIGEILGDWEKRQADRTLQMITDEMFSNPELQPTQAPPPSESVEDPKAPETSPSLEPQPEQPVEPPEEVDVASPVEYIQNLASDKLFIETITIDKLSPHDRKAEAWFQHQPEEIMFNVRCIECKEPMWTWSQREDMCERCGFELRERRQEFYKTQRRDRTINYDAFGRTNEQHVKVGIDAPEQRKINPNETPQPRHVPLDVFGSGGNRGKLRNPFS